MNKIYIKEWFGRSGNNIIQIINAIKYGLDNSYNILYFPKNIILNTQQILISQEEKQIKKEDKYDDKNYYYYSINNNISLNEIDILFIFDTYIIPILNITDTENNYDITYHIRGGDIFINKESNYVQPPLLFYSEIENTLIISEDTKNPCVNELVKKGCKWDKNTLQEDISLLRNAKQLGIGYGTFGLFIILLNKIFTKLYIPEYVYEVFKDKWKIDIKKLLSKKQELIIINLPNYIKVGEWNPTKENINKMLTYN